MQVMINNHLPFEVSVDADRLRDLAWTQLRAVEIDVVAIRVDLATLDSAKPHTMFSAHVAVRLKQGTLRGETFIGHGQTIELALHHALVGVRSRATMVTFSGPVCIMPLSGFGFLRQATPDSPAHQSEKLQSATHW